MRKTYLIVFSASALLALASASLKAQDATHPSENYPGKGGSQDATNGPTGSPEAQNPSTGQQQTPGTKTPSSGNSHTGQ